MNLKWFKTTESEKAAPKQEQVQVQVQSPTQNEIELQNQLIEEQNAAVQGLCKQMTEIHEINTTIATLVDEQGSMVDRIQDHITTASDNMKDANLNVRKADAAYSGIMCNIF